MKESKKITNFAIKPDKQTLKQFKECYSHPFVVKASLMPDAHVGYVAPIGSVLVTKDYLVPSWVGYDIGCGVTAAKLPKSVLKDLKSNAQEIYLEVRKNVPMGLGEINDDIKNISEETVKEFDKIISNFKKGSYNKQVLQFFESGKALRNLGTLGHGNHFISLNEDSKGIPWIVVHSGSRSVGHWAGTLYMQKSSGKKEDYEETHPLHKDSLEGKEYRNLLDFSLEFAMINRLEIISKVVSVIEKVTGKPVDYHIWTNKNHNHVLEEKGLFVHRKGATPAKKGERGIIPANMRDGSFLVEGKGNSDFLSSSSHGAGRVLSRTEAKQKLKAKDFKKEMDNAGVIGNFTDESLDEAPQAYKDINEVLDAQKKSIKIVDHLKPFINWQGERRHRR